MPNSAAIALTDFHVRIDDRTEIRPVHAHDAEDLFALVTKNHEHLYAWMDWLPQGGVTRENIRDFVRRSERAAREQTEHNAVIVQNGEIIGCTGFPEIDWNDSWAHIGYWLDKEHTGKGVVTRAVGALTTYAFEALELNRVEIRCAATNRASAAIPARLGFVHEGTLRRIRLLHGQYVNDLVFAMLRDDWEPATT
ncbi:MAG: GNAT family N-acetyltransferase [Candidatus Baltobacteraceae bacterium]